jgi:hypothetical protein
MYSVYWVVRAEDLLNMGGEILNDDECESSFYERRQERWTRVMQ